MTTDRMATQKPMGEAIYGFERMVPSNVVGGGTYCDEFDGGYREMRERKSVPGAWMRLPVTILRLNTDKAIKINFNDELDMSLE
jgi:hypothetical protein